MSYSLSSWRLQNNIWKDFFNVCMYICVHIHMCCKCKIKIGSHPNVVIGTRHSWVERMWKNKTFIWNQILQVFRYLKFYFCTCIKFWQKTPFMCFYETFYKSPVVVLRYVHKSSDMPAFQELDHNSSTLEGGPHLVTCF